MRLKSTFYKAGAAALIASTAWAANPQPSGFTGELTIGGTGAALGTVQQLANEFQKAHPGLRVKVLPSLGSGGGIKALIAGQLTVSVTSRFLTESERAKGVSAMEIASTPFVFATGMKTPVTDVTLDELAALYSGKTAKWSDGTQVRPVLRPLSDVDTQVVKDMSPGLNLGLNDAHERPGKNIAVTDTESADDLEKIPGAIGTSTLSLIKSEGRQLKVLSVNGVDATITNAISSKYPYLKTIYLIMPVNPSPVAQSFARFINSPSGKAILTQTGNIPAAAVK
jgi:phosphate transport system substrate-binding protein